MASFYFKRTKVFANSLVIIVPLFPPHSLPPLMMVLIHSCCSVLSKYSSKSSGMGHQLAPISTMDHESDLIKTDGGQYCAKTKIMEINF